MLEWPVIGQFASNKSYKWWLVSIVLNPGVENRPVITYAHLSKVDRVA